MRPKFHLTAPRGLINDPNGFINYKGKYYVFFQWNPYGTDHKNKHWGLRTSKDFIHWSDAYKALKPSESYDKDGCYSGSSRIVGDELYLIYTGNVKNDGKRQAYQCLAHKSADKFVKDGPILNELAAGYTAHFRDPFYFCDEGKNYFMLGAKDQKAKGKILVYSWDNLKKPELLGELESNIGLDAYMVECPNVILGDEDILIFSPQGIERGEFHYQNLYHSIGAVGKMDLEKLYFEADNFDELDYGFDFYAPQVLADEKLMIAWMGQTDQEDRDPSRSCGWIHCLTMVRSLSIEEGRLKQRPYAAYEKLRKEESSPKINEKIYSKFGEIRLKLDLHQDAKFKMKLFASDKYYTLLTYEKGILSFDRNESMGLKGIRKLKLEDIDRLDLQIFMDHSTLEVFINDGDYVMSGRAYNPDPSYFELVEVKNALVERYSYYEFEV